ncbi:somatostatin receptor type 2-like [Ptychodera flava]|uniref:somatostatin receptor type 2-like n=1 Tax=Ptychodera flava TaxID=63121 RepID=UPI00396A90CC
MKNGSIVSSAFEDYVYDGNDSSEGYDKHERHSGSYSVSTFSLVLVMVLALGLVGNSAFVYVTLKVPSMRTVLNVYLINLCVADTLFLVTGIPLELYFIHMEEVNEKILRFFHSIFSVIPQFAGLFIVALVSIERYMGICHPFRARYFRTKNRVRISMMACWLAGLLMSLPHTMNSIVVSTDLFTAILICEIVTFVVSMCTVFILYTMIICKLRRDEQVLAKPSQPH